MSIETDRGPWVQALLATGYRHTVTRIFHRLVEEHGADVSYRMVGVRLFPTRIRDV
ncbi:hypothetical protein [Streptomyces collinus]|uniref:hypothetical protein n=1 Tax=Streptomyces collinus TaxID=42684 RepID=UPI0029425177|nr:hypothetical protein [Streptomyces collinus]